MAVKKSQLEARLKTIINMVDEAFNKDQPMMIHTFMLLKHVREVASGKEVLVEEAETINETISTAAQRKIKHVVVSCDASIKKNPGGPAAVGVVIERDDVEPAELAQHCKAVTNNQAEYDAIYFGLSSLVNITNNPQTLVEIRSDSQVVVSQLNGDMECHDETLKHKRDMIWALARSFPSPIKFEWRPRNSTPALEKANFLAQDELGVKRH
jgi:ribonuclease HI